MIQYLDDYTAACPACDRARYTIGARGEVAHAEICQDCFKVCPACQGQEYTYEVNEKGYEVARQCTVCGALKRRIQAFNDARVPYLHRRATLEGFRTHRARQGDAGAGDAIGNLPRVRLRLFHWAKNFTPGERGYLLHGSVGTGKTHLLAGTIRHLTLEKGINARFIEFTHLLSAIKEGFDQGRGETSILGPLSEVPVLAIDELGKGRNTEWQLSIIDEIISKRYNAGLTTLFTTNYDVRESASNTLDVGSPDFRKMATAATLSERVGDRVFSRLHEMADFVHVDAPDYRRAEAQRR
ncbi:cell division protein ZapE [Lujinxingia vulgaris]|uniref:Cell division protein ZapE n=1 Tax=Lujinxingia vulgaris TaxID=2600176 RepID=A0A5C6XDZ2_9DELT|nr:ATP-binding protein [Lujinxingia vulgaris]TXD36332.1 cell division protein ZapE [Lujinxingia vulgaris]